jgi:hypothetical protein
VARGSGQQRAPSTCCGSGSARRCWPCPRWPLSGSWFRPGPFASGLCRSRIPRPLPWGWRQHLHNIYVQYAAERGIPVLLVFLWLAGKVLWDFRRAVGGSPPGARKAILHGSIAALIAILVGGLFEHNLGDSEVLHLFLTLIALGYAAAEAVPAERRTAQDCAA